MFSKIEHGIYWDRKINVSNMIKETDRDIFKTIPKGEILLLNQDIFNDNITAYQIDKIFTKISLHPNHIFIIETEFIQRCRDLFLRRPVGSCENIWIGCIATNQEQANSRIPILLEIPCRIHIAVIKPLAGEIYLDGLKIRYNALSEHKKIDWVICGGGYDPQAVRDYFPYSFHISKKIRVTSSIPVDFEWVDSLAQQCEENEIPFFFTGWGDWFPRDEWEHCPDIELPDDYEIEFEPAGNTPDGRTFRFEESNGLAHFVGKKKSGRTIRGITYNEMPCLH